MPDLLQYEDKMMFYPSAQTKGRANDLLYQSQAWGDRGLGQALQRLVERDQRREQEEDQKAGLRATLPADHHMNLQQEVALSLAPPTGGKWWILV